MDYQWETPELEETEEGLEQTFEQDQEMEP